MKSKLFVFAFFAFLLNASAQNMTQGAGAWYMYAGQFKLSPKWGIHFDGQFRADLKTNRLNQYMGRAGVQYYFSDKSNATVGSAHISTYSALINRQISEHRVWQQFILKFSGTHRIRLEQRFAQRLKIDAMNAVSTDGYNSGNRLRYMYRTLFDLSKNKERMNMPYVAFQNEVFLNFLSPSFNSNVFDQNRFLAGFGLFHKKHTRFEIGYLNQLVNPSKGNDVMNHIVQVAVMQSLSFYE